MPRTLFEAMIAASGAERLFIATDIGPMQHVEIPPTWAAYSEHMGFSRPVAIDYLIHDGSGRWACLADFDVTHFGADPDLADEVDTLLANHGTSLAAMTIEAFGDLLPDPHLAAVMGSGN
jgi:hypothetical protein